MRARYKSRPFRNKEHHMTANIAKGASSAASSTLSAAKTLDQQHHVTDTVGLRRQTYKAFRAVDETITDLNDIVAGPRGVDEHGVPV